MAAKLTHHGGQIIYVIYIIFYGVTNAPYVHLDDVQESNWTADNLIYNTTLAKILGIFYPNILVLAKIICKFNHSNGY